MKQKRLDFCLKYRNFDWRDVIWTDETSVVLGHRRGRVRVWRRPDERDNIHCIRRRWKGVKEFMFWGCFPYYEKGPCHIWKDETMAEKKAAIKDLEARNAVIEETNRRMQEITSGVQRIGLRNKPGTKPKWKHTKENGAFVRTKSSKGGIDWYRYQEVILKKKLLPFAKRHTLSYPNTIVQEDGASCHTSDYNKPVFDLWQIKKLLWPGNSPDLNAIEPTQWWMKQKTTKRGAPTSKKELQKKWLECWEELDQERIQRWVNRIKTYIKEIIRLKGGNKYIEGLVGVSFRTRWKVGADLSVPESENQL